jgi:CO dehydrogenase nickel-insertion accessory protein CooC1
MKIGICGKMASGKTTIAEYLTVLENEPFEIISMAGEVKRVGRELFGMTKKDRPLLQKIGMKMREIRQSVWLDAVISQANQSKCSVVCDDVRFVNEAKSLKKDGWIPLDWFDLVITAANDSSVQKSVEALISNS